MLNNLTKTKSIVFIGLFVTLNVVCAWITIPYVIPFTLQTLAVYLTVSMLGFKRGVITILIYILLGILGVPVFSGFQGGISVILGPTGGFIIGFLLSTIVYSLLRIVFKNNLGNLLSMILSLPFCYLVGCLWYGFVYLTSNELSFASIVITCVVPYIIPDLIKIVISWIVSLKLSKILNKNYTSNG